jgi:hypothetical protein
LITQIIGLVGSALHVIFIEETDEGVISSVRLEILSDSHARDFSQVPDRICLRGDIPSDSDLDRMIIECRDCTFTGVSSEMLERLLPQRSRSLHRLEVISSGLSRRALSQAKVASFEIRNCWFEDDFTINSVVLTLHIPLVGAIPVSALKKCQHLNILGRTGLNPDAWIYQTVFPEGLYEAFRYTPAQKIKFANVRMTWTELSIILSTSCKWLVLDQCRLVADRDSSSNMLDNDTIESFGVDLDGLEDYELVELLRSLKALTDLILPYLVISDLVFDSFSEMPNLRYLDCRRAMELQVGTKICYTVETVMAHEQHREALNQVFPNAAIVDPDGSD